MMAWPDTLADRAHEALLNHPGAEEARAYLRSRGVAEAQWITYRIGFAAPDLQVEASPEFISWMPAYWYGRLVFPMVGVIGKVTGFQTRALDSKLYQSFPVYPTEVFPLAFGIHQALPSIWETRMVAVTEGVFDCLAVASVVPHVVAALTAAPSASLQRFLRRFADRVVVLTDMDEAGRRGAQRIARALKGIAVTAPAYPAHDPGDLIRQPGGAERLRTLFSSQVVQIGVDSSPKSVSSW